MTNEHTEEYGLGRLEPPEPEPDFPETLQEGEEPDVVEEEEDGIPAGEDNNQPGH